MRLAISTDLDISRVENLPIFLKGVFDTCSLIPQLSQVVVVITGYSSDLARLDFGEYKDKVVTASIPDGSEWGNVYPTGYKTALANNADIVLEMDMGGTHNPSEIKLVLAPIISALEENKNARTASFSSRNLPGSENYYKTSRQLTSKIGTQLAKWFLLGNQGKSLSDLTSGFEAFSRAAVEYLFQRFPPEHMITPSYGPFYLWQTEIRVLAILAGIEYKEVAITYGKGVKSYGLSLKTYLRAGWGFALLLSNKIRGKYSIPSAI
ncbi:hypothetical protein A2450_01870 [candidate division WWE3 bacterium RIFOXYC2_FULL_40_11]|nr:MAG: hypothetical protein A2450_01870 [candidate division WWE3 bacterium RIFOXYC2_FULL_40_11]OGC70686.1 MAG: hypothetical protein A2602_00095 [candidate division WWE3 bacterium RIFOXYD1_FULL_40_11]